MKILGLDLSLSGTGIVKLDEQGDLDGWEVVRTKPSQSDLERASQVASFVVAATDVEHGVPVDLVAIEGIYASRNLDTFRRLAELSFLVRYRLWRREVLFEVFSPAEWRKYLFGPFSKITQKDQTRVAVSRRYEDRLGGLEIEQMDENVLDAFCVAQAAYRKHVEGIVIDKPARRRAAS